METGGAREGAGPSCGAREGAGSRWREEGGRESVQGRGWKEEDVGQIICKELGFGKAKEVTNGNGE